MNGEFSEKYDKYSDMLYKISYLYFGNKSDSEDALQEAFVKLLYNSPPFRDENHEKAWLIRSMQNICLNMLKKSARKQPAIEDITDFSKSDEKDMSIDILNAVLSLEPKYKTVILLYHYYDYSVNEIASTLQIGKSAAKMRLKRGREQLKTELEGYDNE